MRCQNSCPRDAQTRLAGETEFTNPTGGPLVAAAGLAGIARLRPGFSYWTELLPPLLVFSIGLSLIVAPLTATVLADAGERDAGIASGFNNAIARVAGLLGIAIIGAAVANGHNLDWSGVRLAMAITAALVATGGLVGISGIRNAQSTPPQRSSSSA